MIINQWVLIAAAVGVVLLLLIVILAIRSANKKKAMLADMEDSQEDVPVVREIPEVVEEEVVEEIEPVEPEIFVPEVDRGAELRESIRDFADQNPEISAQLLKAWLNGGENNDN